jgi:hypothetical protein
MKNKYWDKVRAKKLVIYLEGISTEKWVNSKSLEKICELEYQNPESHERKIRVLIKNTVKQFGIPIVSVGSKGYKIALTQEDIDQYKKRMYAQWNGVKEGIKDVQLAFDIYNKGHIKKFSDLIDISKPKRIKLKIKGGGSNKLIFA